MTVYFIRHGETGWNAEGRLQGQTERPLNERGMLQAAQVGKTLAKLLKGNTDLPWACQQKIMLLMRGFSRSPLAHGKARFGATSSSVTLPAPPRAPGTNGMLFRQVARATPCCSRVSRPSLQTWSSLQ
jgi:hypothetical protein